MEYTTVINLPSFRLTEGTIFERFVTPRLAQKICTSVEGKGW